MAPRTAQKNRTRIALLASARDLMAKGEDITVARVADAAQISRATAYRYFSDPGAIMTEVTLDLELMSTEELLSGIEDVRARVHAVARYYLEFSSGHEAEFRHFLAHTMKRWAEGHRGELRGARRTGAFSQALEPAKARMAEDDVADLVHRLSMVTGIEQHIAIADILRLDPETGTRMQAGLVDALLDKYLPN